MVSTAVAVSKTYEHLPSTSPHPAGFGPTVTPSDTVVFKRATRWVMITDLSAKAVSLRLAGVYRTITPIVGSSGDMAMGTGGVLVSTTASKFASLTAGDAVQLSGFQSNNGLYVVGSVTNSNKTLNLKVPGTLNPDFSGGTAANTTVETPTGSNAVVTGPPIPTQDTITFTALPGVMYPICADMLFATATAATSIIAFH